MRVDEIIVLNRMEMIKVLKVINLSIETIDNINDEQLDTILRLAEQENELFNYDGDEGILFYEWNKDEIEKYFGVKFIDQYIRNFKDYFDGFLHTTKVIRVHDLLQIRKIDCIRKFQDNLGEYEYRILNSNNFYEETEIIIKEQVLDVLDSIFSEAKMNIENGELDWK
jgi:hypothetical protein